MGEESPADHAANDVTCGKSNVDVEGLEFGEASSLEEDNGESENGIAAKNLSGPDDGILTRC